MSETRIEKDSMGEVVIPKKYLYGGSTQRAVDNFPISGEIFSPRFIQMLAILKKCCALTNQELGLLEGNLAKTIVGVADEIAQGQHYEHFIVDVFQTGSGTSTNMNFNEVASNLANLKLGSEVGTKSPVHPNDHVNRGQSSNDVIPTTIHLAVVSALKEELIPTLKNFAQTLTQKEKEFQPIIKTGRTHLQDATPLSLGQEFSGFRAQIENSINRLERSIPSLLELSIGGTAVGTGINTHPEFGKKVCEKLASETGYEFIEARNHFESQASKDACVEASGTLRSTAVAIYKIANDIRWMGCGPRAGFSELKLPAVQPGSSIMPGKVNPVMAEALLQVCTLVIGNDAAVAFAGTTGSFQLNVMMPLIARNLLQSINYLSRAVGVFDKNCVAGLEADTETISSLIERGLMLATSLAPEIGYDKAAALAKKAYQQNKTIREIALEETDLTPEQLDQFLDPSSMIAPQ